MVSDIVDTYNQVYASAKSATDPVNGDLKSDIAAKTMLRSLQTLTTKTLTSSGANGAPTTLAQREAMRHGYNAFHSRAAVNDGRKGRRFRRYTLHQAGERLVRPLVGRWNKLR